ncbi:MAG: hypothetical protein DRJ32_06270 [Thermoprotei archaeon]|nr:MAG: hypothetical protein B6U94_07705 [Thermofilum sp. ex4484_79]RLE58528.1 MAG: hypothetical protein DRJ32_06270 [Thermoprotei archaeon]HDD63628.1 hypothetical protein [Thermoprotei archaeon]
MSEERVRKIFEVIVEVDEKLSILRHETLEKLKEIDDLLNKTINHIKESIEKELQVLYEGEKDALEKELSEIKSRIKSISSDILKKIEKAESRREEAIALIVNELMGEEML